MYERSSSKNIYLNVAVNTLKKLRSKSSSSPSPVTSMSPQSLCRAALSIYSLLIHVMIMKYSVLPYLLSTENPGSAAKRKAQSHEEVLGGRLAATTSFTVNRMGKQQEEKLTGKGQTRFSFILYTEYIGLQSRWQEVLCLQFFVGPFSLQTYFLEIFLSCRSHFPFLLCVFAPVITSLAT